ncbi:unnamed protein product [Heligmosomoides polygyrus]|uniref:Rhodanese domain-containing protein n=1 Tax=Heligmosomoides polygyrus TaxID=6339 RepID=A0A183GGH1_HELPZ|nr:unnamed protein product [Heligmosomoides polygyrus]
MNTKRALYLCATQSTTPGSCAAVKSSLCGRFTITPTYSFASRIRQKQNMFCYCLEDGDSPYSTRSCRSGLPFRLFPCKWSAEFFNQVVKEKKVPKCCHNSTTIPIWKKGSPADCSNYRPIRLLSHSTKIFERISIDEFVKSSGPTSAVLVCCGTIDAIHAARLLVEKHRQKQKPVHIAFVDALRQHGVPEELIEWVRMLYPCPKSSV